MMYGWIKAVYTYQCQWCERTEVVEVKGNERYAVPPQLDGWREDPNPMMLNICSSDCQKERDDCIQKARAQCEPAPRGQRQPGYERAYARLRLEMLRERGRKVTGS